MKVLVTGASGYLGSVIVERLVQSGHQVEAFVRPSSDLSRLAGRQVELVTGDIRDEDALRAAMADVNAVVHAAADTSGSARAGRDVTVAGSELVARLCREQTSTRLVYISSCSVYDVAGVEAGGRIDETSALEPHPELRGPYSWAKHAAEQAVRELLADSSERLVVLRPGIIYGGREKVFSPSLGFSFRSKLFLVIGPRQAELPMVHVANVAEAIVRILAVQTLHGTFNVLDAESVTKQQFMDRAVKPRHPSSVTVYLPWWLVRVVTAAQEKFFRLLGREPVLSTYRLKSSQNPVSISGRRLMEALGWQAPGRVGSSSDGSLP